MDGFLASSMSLEVYRDYLENPLCWVDGTPTHASSALQQQCPACRRKWSYRNRFIRLNLLAHYAERDRAGAAALTVGCSRNTAQKFYREMDKRTALLLQVLRLVGGIGIVDENLTHADLERIARNPGKYSQEKAVSRAIFFHGTEVDRRIELLAELEILAAAERVYRIQVGQALPAGLYIPKRTLPRADWRRKMQVAARLPGNKKTRRVLYSRARTKILLKSEQTAGTAAPGISQENIQSMTEWLDANFTATERSLFATHPRLLALLFVQMWEGDSE